MEIEITQIDKEDLIDFLSVATYGSNWLEVHILKSERHLDTQKDFDSREEHWAHRLLNGGHIVCCDSTRSKQGLEGSAYSASSMTAYLHPCLSAWAAKAFPLKLAPFKATNKEPSGQ